MEALLSFDYLMPLAIVALLVYAAWSWVKKQNWKGWAGRTFMNNVLPKQVNRDAIDQLLQLRQSVDDDDASKQAFRSLWDAMGRKFLNLDGKDDDAAKKK